MTQVFRPLARAFRRLVEDLPGSQGDAQAIHAVRASDGSHSYDVCLSFAGEDRDYVERVAVALRDTDIRVFYDDYERVELWGLDLYQHLDAVYRQRSRFCVIFISQHYANKVWPSHELQSAQARALVENREYVLPARFDDTELPGLRPTTAYVDLRRLEPEQLAVLIWEKLRSREDEPAREGSGVEQGAQVSPTHQVGEPRSENWLAEGRRLWAVVSVAPTQPLTGQFDPQGIEVLDAIHEMRLPTYLAAPLTASPNRYLTRPMGQGRLVHEDLRKLDDGVGFRVEVTAEGLMKLAICLDELLTRISVESLQREDVGQMAFGSASAAAARALLPHVPFFRVVIAQIELVLELWMRARIPAELATVATELHHVRGTSLLVVWRREALLGHPAEEEPVRVQVEVGMPPDTQTVASDLVAGVVRSFGLRVDRLIDAKGEFVSPGLIGRPGS